MIDKTIGPITFDPDKDAEHIWRLAIGLKQLAIDLADRRKEIIEQRAKVITLENEVNRLLGEEQHD